jgi:hypothetical protein
MSFTVWLIGSSLHLVWLISSRRSLGEATGALCDHYRLALVLGGHASTNAEMNGPFVLASRVSPPQGRTVMVRSGGLVFSDAFRRNGWALISGSGETSMPNPPEEWGLDDALAKEMGLDIDAIEAERRTLMI